MAVSKSLTISPRKVLRSDLYSYSYQNNSKTPLVISLLSSLIDRTLSRNQKIGRKVLPVSYSSGGGGKTHIFDCREIPDMTIQLYLERIFRYTKTGPSVYVVAYVYIDRFCQINPGFRISLANVHRLLITTIMIASKYVEDLNYRNSYFAKVGGLKTEDLNRLELEFLFLMGFKLHVNVSVFKSYCCRLEREVSFGGGYQIEKTLRCAEEIKSRQVIVQDPKHHHHQFAQILL